MLVVVGNRLQNNPWQQRKLIKFLVSIVRCAHRTIEGGSQCVARWRRLGKNVKKTKTNRKRRERGLGERGCRIMEERSDDRSRAVERRYPSGAEQQNFNEQNLGTKRKSVK